MTDFEVLLAEPTHGPRVLTPKVSNLSFRSTDPGGFSSVSFDLAREPNAPDFELDSDVFVYDAETGEQVGGGRILNPGRDVSEQGSVWQVSVLGEGPAHLQEREIPYHLIDTRLTPSWTKGFVTNARLDWNQGEQPGNSGAERPGWTFVISPGALNIGYIGRLNYYDMEQYSSIGGQFRTEIGGYAFRDIEGNGTNANRIQSTISSFGSWGITPTDYGFDITARIRRRWVGGNVTGDGWPAGGLGPSSNQPANKLTIRYERTTSSAPNGVGGDDDWMHVWDLRVSALRLDRNQDPITGNVYERDYVLAHEAITDCWARFCPRLDVANARIDETGTFQHRDLVWPDGITPYGVMDKMMEFDPAFTWAVWERQSNGKYRVEWRQRDFTVRYEIPSDVGFSQTSSASGPLDDAYVVAESPSGLYRVFHTYVDFDSQGRSKTVKFEAKVDAADFDASAIALGQDTLDNSELVASSAQVTVARKVYDHYTGRWVQPFMVLPGYLCRVNGVRTAANLMDTVENDGAAVFRIASNDYSASSGTARLELNSYTITEAQAIADLVNAR